MKRKRYSGFLFEQGVRLTPVLVWTCGMLLTMVSMSKAQSLDSYLTTAAENNPDLEAIHQQYLAALERIPQVGALPDPMLSLGFFVIPVETRVGPQQAKLSLTQQFPWFGSLAARKDAAAQMAIAQLVRLEGSKQFLFFRVKKQWYSLYENEKIVAITQENIEILHSLESLALTRYEAGVAGLVDVIRVQLLISEMENEQKLLEGNIKPLTAAFNQLLNRDLQIAVELPDSLEDTGWYPVDFNQLVQNHPQVQYFHALKEELDLQDKIAVLKSKPNFGVGLDYGFIGKRNISDLPDNGKNVLMPMVSLSLPLSQKKYRADRQEVKYKSSSVEQQTQSVMNQLQTDYEFAFRNYQDAARKMELYADQITWSNQALNILISSFSAAGKDFEEVLRMQQLILKYQTLMVKAQAAKHSAIAELEYLSSQYNLKQE